MAPVLVKAKCVRCKVCVCVSCELYSRSSYQPLIMSIRNTAALFPCFTSVWWTWAKLQFFFVAKGYRKRSPHLSSPLLLASYIAAKESALLLAPFISLTCFVPPFTPASHRHMSPLTFTITFKPFSFEVPSSLSCYCSPCTAPPLVFHDPLPIPPTMLPSPTNILLFFSLPPSFPLPLPLCFS